jgi:hypothetical protein
MMVVVVVVVVVVKCDRTTFLAARADDMRWPSLFSVGAGASARSGCFSGRGWEVQLSVQVKVVLEREQANAGF